MYARRIAATSSRAWRLRDMAWICNAAVAAVAGVHGSMCDNRPLMLESGDE